MPTKVRAYMRATDLAEAVRLLQQPDTAAWIPAPRMPEAPPAPILVDLQALNLARITVEGDTVHIGGQTTLEMLATHPVVQGIADGILAQAARLAAHRGLRNLATVEGALRSDDGPPELLLAFAALNATATLATTSGTETCEVFALEGDRALVVDVAVPLSHGCRGSMARVARTPLDQAIVAAVAVANAQNACVAVSAEAGTLNMASTSLHNMQDSPAALASLIDSLAETVTEGADPVGDYRGSATYRLAMAETLARRALTEALQEVFRS